MSMTNIQSQAIVSGIDEEKLKKLILDVYSYAERIKVRLDSAQSALNTLDESYSGVSSDFLKERLAEFSKNFSIVNSNVQLLATDLTKVKNNFHKIVNEISEYPKRVK